jgi:hypothetical protein
MFVLNQSSLSALSVGQSGKTLNEIAARVEKLHISENSERYDGSY